jgi:soluble lytic murein transglycosylase-like protein
LPLDNQGRPKAPETTTHLARPKSARHSVAPGEALSQPGAQNAPQADYAHSRQLNGIMLSGGVIFLLAMAMHATTLWDVQNNIRELAGVSADIRRLAAHSDLLARVRDYRTRPREQSQPEIAGTPSETVPAATTALTRPTDSEARQPESAPQSPSSSTASYRRAPANPLEYGRWGPPLVSNYSRASRITVTRDALTDREQVQSDLLALGFDVSTDQATGRTGKHTLQALDEFTTLYLPASGRQTKPDNDRLAASIGKYAALARKDAQKFSVESGILAAIRLGSRRTGVEFDFLMELAATESSFDPTSIAPVTAAAGLYQFKDDTWLEAVRRYGNKYGMGVYASQVESYTDTEGSRRLRIHDHRVQEYVLALRHNPRLSALLAAEYIKLNRKQLSASLDREPGHTEMYLTHFFGAAGAISFLKALAENPDRIAGEVFPTAAEHNKALFRPERSKPRTIAEIYRMFERRFSRSRFLDANPS